MQKPIRPILSAPTSQTFAPDPDKRATEALRGMPERDHSREVSQRELRDLMRQRTGVCG